MIGTVKDQQRRHPTNPDQVDDVTCNRLFTAVEVGASLRWSNIDLQTLLVGKYGEFDSAQFGSYSGILG